MEIVIKLREDDYKRIVKEGLTVFGSDADIALLERALESGTPLPKGHGRLIDGDILKRQNCCSESYVKLFTIIEADKECE